MENKPETENQSWTCIFSYWRKILRKFWSYEDFSYINGIQNEYRLNLEGDEAAEGKGYTQKVSAVKVFEFYTLDQVKVLSAFNQNKKYIENDKQKPHFIGKLGQIFVASNDELW